MEVTFSYSLTRTAPTTDGDIIDGYVTRVRRSYYSFKCYLENKRFKGATSRTTHLENIAKIGNFFILSIVIRLNLCQSKPSLFIFSVFITPFFFYAKKLLFWGFLQFEIGKMT